MARLLAFFTPLKWLLVLLSLLSFGVLVLVVVDMNKQGSSAIGSNNQYQPAISESRKDWLVGASMKSLDWQGEKLYRYIKEKDYLMLAQHFGAFSQNYRQWKTTKATQQEIDALNQGVLTFGGLSAYDMEVLIPYFSKQCNSFDRFYAQDIFEYYLSIRAPKPIELLDSMEQRTLNGKLEWVSVLSHNQFPNIVNDWFSEYAYQIDDTYSNDLLFTLLTIYQTN